MANNLVLLNGPNFNASAGHFGGAITAGTGTTAANILPTTGGFTFEAWFTYTGGASGVYLIAGSSDTFWLGASSGTLTAHFGVGSTESVINSSAAIPTGFSHVALVCGTAATTLYLNGAVVASSAQTLSTQGATFANPVGIHSFENNRGSFTWAGAVDEAAFWTGSHYTAAFTPPTAPYTGSEAGLIALYHLDTDGTDSKTAAAAASMGTPAFSGTVAGGSTTVTGSYTNGTPTSLTYVLDGGAATAAASATISGGTYSFAITTPAAGAHTLAVTGAGANTATSPAGSFTTTAAGVFIAPNNAAIVYSPYNWQVLAGSATAWNPGAYFKTLFFGASCVLTFNVSANAAPLSQIWWRVDNGPWTQTSVAATITCTAPAITTGNADVPAHRLDVVVKSMDSSAGVNRWIPPTPGAIQFTGINLAAGAGVLVPGKASLNILVYGDSITEGIRTLGEGTPTVNANDAMFSWALELGNILGAEVGVVGFGGTGYTSTYGSVPVFPTSFNLIAQGISRVFTPAPDLVVVNHGTNDGATDVTAAATQALNGLLAAVACKVVLLNAFPLGNNAYLPAAVSACSAPSRAAFVSTTGFFNLSAGTDSVNTHPSGPNAVSLIAPKVAAVLRPLLSGAVTVARWTH